MIKASNLRIHKNKYIRSEYYEKFQTENLDLVYNKKCKKLPFVLANTLKNKE